MSEPTTPFDVLEFWWSAGALKWWVRDEAFDAMIRDRFAEVHAAAAAGKLDHWADSPYGMLALIILLDQFSRNMHRGSPEAFAQDEKALALSCTAVARGWHRAWPEPARSFFYMPMMHAEDMEAQEQCVDLARQGAGAENYRYALEHLDIIRRFGRFPHRNEALGRLTTAAEQAYLDSGGFRG